MSKAAPISLHVGLFITRLVDLTHPSVRFATLKFLEMAGCRILVPEQNPTTLNFFPPVHITVLNVADFTVSYEDVWTKLRTDLDDKDHSSSLFPLTVNMITGTSQTGDI